jgi:opacity protein-like surface antigen
MASILLFSAQQANAELTLSLDLIKDSGDRDVSFDSSLGSESTITGDSAADGTGYRLRLGFDSIKENRVELYFSQYEVDEEKKTNGLINAFNYKDEWELGINYIVTFLKKPVNPSLAPLSPFLKVGLGYGQADTDVEFRRVSSVGITDTTDNISNFHLNLGGGLSYSFTDNLSVSGGIEYIYRNWQDIETGYGTTIDTTDGLFRFGAGINVSF